MIIEQASVGHWPAIKEIFQQGINTGHTTFMVAPPESWQAWIAERIVECCLVCRQDDRVVGWASLANYSSRPVYAGVAIVNIYVAADRRGHGIGSALLAALIREAEAIGIWTLEARIFPENEASRRLHERHGFRRVGLRKRLGRMTYGPRQGEWRDVLLLERRSARVGI